MFNFKEGKQIKLLFLYLAKNLCMKTDNLPKVINILKKYTYEKDILDEANLGMRLMGDLKINSARIVDIVLDVEEEFDLEMDDDSLARLITIQDILEVIESKKS